MLLLRLAVEVEVAEGGVLRPRSGSAWRPEPARGESRIHRRLASLVGASDAQIARFASKYGFLRRYSSGILGLPGPASEASTVLAGQDLAEDLLRLREWIERGALGDPPSGTENAVPLLVLFASLPDPLLEAGEALAQGLVKADSLAPDTFFQAAAASAFAAQRVFATEVPHAGHIRHIEGARLRAGLRLYEWGARMFARLDDPSPHVAAIGGTDAMLRSLTTHVPDAFAIPAALDVDDGAVATRIESMSAERASDWRDEAADLARICRSIDLITSALGTEGISSAERGELVELYVALHGHPQRVRLTAAEVAERLTPLLALRLQDDLASIGAWPLNVTAPVGVYARALIAAWTELTGKTPPVRCATPDCGRDVQATRNRRYCDVCQAERRRQGVRRSRARPQTGEAG